LLPLNSSVPAPSFVSPPLVIGTLIERSTAVGDIQQPFCAPKFKKPELPELAPLWITEAAFASGLRFTLPPSSIFAGLAPGIKSIWRSVSELPFSVKVRAASTCGV